MKVCIVQSVIKHYRVPFFDALHEKLKADGIELQVLYSEPTPTDSLRGDNVDPQGPYATKVRARWMFGERVLYQSILAHVRDADLVIIEQANKYVLNYWLLVKRKLGLTRVAFWGHGRNRQSNSSTFSEWFKRVLLRQVDWWFAYTDGTARYLVEHRVAIDRITSVRNATDTTALRRLVAAVQDSETVKVRQRLGIAPESPVGLFVGALYDHKLLPLLIDSVAVIQGQVPAFRLVIIGGGPQKSLVEEATRANPAILYVGSQFGDDRAVYYRMASLFLNPGLIGLGILDAFAGHLPVITTNYPYHSPEIEYLESDRNGVMTGPTAEEFGDAVAKLLLDPVRLVQMKEEACKSSSMYTIEAMATRFRNGILSWLERKSASTNSSVHCEPQPTDGQAETAQAIVSKKRVAMLTNYIPPYRVPPLVALQQRTASLKLLLSSRGPESLRGQELRGLDFEVLRSWSFRRTYVHPGGFRETLDIHVPYSILWRLMRLRPEVLISTEMGARTAQAALYCWLNPDCRLVIHADLSEHTERGFGQGRQRLRSWLLQQATAVIVNGASGARYIRSFGVPPERIFKVPYGTDLALFTSPRAREDARSVGRLVYVGQLIERKGLLPFLRHLSDWLTRNPDVRLEFVIAGKGPLLESIVSFAAPTNLKLSVIGEVPYQKLPELYCDCDLFILPTLADTWALVVNEALATGLPVLGSDRSQAVEEMVVDGENGWVFSPDEPLSVARALDSALRVSPDRLAVMRGKARETASRVNAEYVAERMREAIAACFA